MSKVRSMARRTKGFLRRLHEDETGPNTVEWILLIVVALVVLIGIYVIVQWVRSSSEGQATEMEQQREKAVDDMKNFNP